MSKCYQVCLTFTEPLLGTVPQNKELYQDFIASKAPMAVSDEVATVNVAEEVEKGTTGFHRVDGDPIIYDYVILGFLKDACGMLRRVEGSLSSKVTAYKKIIDGLVFVAPRRIPLLVNGKVDVLERPLRAQTAQGERVALARSEMVPTGSILEFEVQVLDGVSEALLREWFAYGKLRGIGQWRNASYGRFHYALKVVP